VPPHSDSAAAKHTTVRVSDPGEATGEATLDQPALVLDYGTGLVYLEGSPQELLALTHQMWTAATALAMPWARHQFLITVAGGDPATETVVRQLTADLSQGVDGHSPLRVSVHRLGGPGHELYERTCRVGGERFYAYRPHVDVCHSHWYDEQIAHAQGLYAPLVDAIQAATGLRSYLWQSGGMTMTLVTPWGDQQQQPPVGDRYLTLIEQFHPEGRLEGASSFAAAADQYGSARDTVLVAYDDERLPPGREPSSPAQTAVFSGPLLPHRWAQELAADYQRRRRGTPPQSS
jgi:hypothetical protein